METVSTYIPPDIISEMDDDVIHARMLARLPADIDKTPGSFAYDFTRPAALEKAEMVISLNECLKIAFPEWSYGEFTELHARAEGLTRKAAVPAETMLSITGTVDHVIPAGFLFSTAQTATSPSVVFAVDADTAIRSDGTATVLVKCTQAGTVGNVPENSITLMVNPDENITSVTNPAAATGGTAQESISDLIGRIIDKEQHGESSYVGSPSDYHRWALEVSGVGAASVIPEWMGEGTGTVKVIIMDSNGQPATETLIDAVYDHIISPNDEPSRLAPVGAMLTVSTATPVEITIAATVELEGNATIDGVESAFLNLLSTYMTEAKSESCFRYTRIGSLLSETTGVLDYDTNSLLINGGTANITIDADDYPMITSITLTEA